MGASSCIHGETTTLRLYHLAAEPSLLTCSRSRLVTRAPLPRVRGGVLSLAELLPSRLFFEGLCRSLMLTTGADRCVTGRLAFDGRRRSSPHVLDCCTWLPFSQRDTLRCQNHFSFSVWHFLTPEGVPWIPVSQRHSLASGLSVTSKGLFGAGRPLAA